MPKHEINGSTISYDSFTKGPEVKYHKSGIFQFKGIEFDLTEARLLADSIGEIITGKTFLVSEMLTTMDEEELRQSIEKRYSLK
jgi:hypothetical protein